MPLPKVLSTPAGLQSVAPAAKAARICAGVAARAQDFSNAATAATWGAAADVPANGDWKPPAPVTRTLSTAVTVGVCRTSAAGNAIVDGPRLLYDSAVHWL